MCSFPALAIAYAIAAVANFALSVTVGRTLGAAALGDYALALAISRMFYAATDLGLGSHLTRSLSRAPELAQPRTALFVWFRAALVPIALGLLVVIGIGRDAPVLFAAVALAQGITSLQLLYEGLLLSQGRQNATAALTVGSAAAIGIGCGAWYALHAPLAAFGIAYAVCATAGFLPWVWFAGRRLHVWPRTSVDRSVLGGELAQAWPIGASMFLGILALRCPVLVLGAFGTDADVGAYSAVDIFITGGAILQSAITNATFPRLASTFRREPAAFRRMFWRSNALLAAVGVAIAIGLALFGTRVALAVFPGRDFSRIASIMPILAWSTPCLLLVHHNILIFAASDNERTNVRLMVLWSVLIAVGQLALVPQHGLVGAAWGVLLARGAGALVLALAISARGIHRGEPGRAVGV